MEKVVGITPKRITLRGPVGRDITGSATIIPEEKYRFKITKVRAEKGNHIQVTWKEYETGKGPGYRVTVKNLKRESGRYFDTIILTTDSTIRPEIRIGIAGKITDR